MPIRPFLFFVALALALANQLSAQTNGRAPKYQGLLWEISGKGTTKPSYLYGTMHIPEKLAFNLSDSFFIALRACDVVSLETDHDVWQSFTEKVREEMEQMQPGVAIANKFNFNYIDLYGGLFKFEAPGAKLLEGMFGYKPVMANEFLYRSNRFMEDFEEDTYLDLFIFQAGKKLGKQVIGLETMEDSYEFVTRASMPDDEDEEESEADYNRKYVNPNAMRDVYRRQDLSALDSLNRIMAPGKNFRKYMLEVRNRIMADGIDSVLQAGKTMFSAVGAAHLPGDIGVIEMLRELGYQVRPVKFSFDTERKEMAEIENLKYPVTLSRQWAADSAWSADAPGKFYATADNWRINQALAADMSNGVYYAVYRIKTFGLWTGQSPEYISNRIDSLIYEKVPGKIQQRKRLQSPFPGHEITTRTRRGDIQRFKVLITPTEIMMFLMGGNRDYAAGPEGDQFFNSIQVFTRKEKNQPTLVKPDYGGFEVVFPNKPLINNSEDPKTQVYIAGYADGPDSAYYFLTRVTYHDLEFIEEDTFELNIIPEMMAEGFTKGRPQFNLKSEGPYPTQDFTFQSDRDSAWYFGRLVIDGPHYYLLGCRKRSASPPADFFDGFKITPLEWPGGFETVSDTNFNYTVLKPVAERKALSPFVAKLQSIRKEIEDKMRKKYKDDFANYATRNQVLHSEKTGESVFLSVMPIAELYEFPDADSLFRSMRKNYSQNNLLLVKDAKMQQKGDSLIVIDLLMTDTNSTRGVKTKIFQTSSACYVLQTTVNAEHSGSAFVQNIFDAFVPTDSSLRKPIVFGQRKLDFLEGLYAKDSMEQETACQEFHTFMIYEYKKEDFEAVHRALSHPGFDQLKFRHKERLLSALGATQSSKAFPALRRFYETHSDSVRYQSAALAAIARTRSQEGFEFLFDLWKNGQGFMSPEDLGTSYSELKDTLPLARRFTKELVRQSAQEPDHNYYTLSLLIDLLDKNLIQPKSYRKIKSRLLANLNKHIQEKRYQTEIMKDQSEDYRNYPYRQEGNYPPQYSGNSVDEFNYQFSIKLLAPFYKTDPMVKSTFDRLLKYGENADKVEAIDLMLSNGIQVDPALIRTLAADAPSTYGLYKALVNNESIAPYRTLFSDTIALVRSFILSAFTPDDVDSVRFISKHKSVINQQPAHLYFFDVKRKKVKDCVLTYVTLPTDLGVTPRKKSDPETDPYLYFDRYGNQLVQTNGSLTTDQEKQEFIRKKVAEIRFEGRKRYRSRTDVSNYYDY